jgi:hypothetical protein
VVLSVPGQRLHFSWQGAGQDWRGIGVWFVFGRASSAPGSLAAKAWNSRRCQPAGRGWPAEPPEPQPFAPAKVLARKAQGWFRQRMIEASRNSYRRAHRWKEARMPIAPGRNLPLPKGAPPKNESRISNLREFLPRFDEPSTSSLQVPVPELQWASGI